jgi:hypothetical protein
MIRGWLGLSFLLAVTEAGPTWCGKHYLVGDAPTPPNEASKFPTGSSLPPLDFRCTPASSIYIANDEDDPPAILIDTITYNVGNCECKYLSD